jgi:hypothetical protein
MIPTGLKLYFGIALAAVTAAVLGGYTSGGDGVGPLSAGYKGGVGDQVSYTILMAIALASLVIGSLLTYFRDADAEAVAEEMGLEQPPVGQRPVAASIWPIIAGAAFGAVMVGLAVSPLLFKFGLVVLVIVAFEWTMTAWSERATGDAAANETLRDQIMKPFEVPLLSLLGGAVFVLSMSRILLATTEIGAVIIGAVVAVIILGTGALIAQQPKLSKNLVTGLVAVVLVGVLAGGVWGAIAGTRDIEEHDEEHHDDGGSSESSDEMEEAAQ